MIKRLRSRPLWTRGHHWPPRPTGCREKRPGRSAPWPKAEEHLYYFKRQSQSLSFRYLIMQGRHQAFLEVYRFTLDHGATFTGLERSLRSQWWIIRYGESIDLANLMNLNSNLALRDFEGPQCFFRRIGTFPRFEPIKSIDTDASEPEPVRGVFSTLMLTKDDLSQYLHARENRIGPTASGTFHGFLLAVQSPISVTWGSLT